MTQVKPGMSKHDVVDLLGPPLDYLSLGDLLGSHRYGGTVRSTGPGDDVRVVPKDQLRLADTVNWLYLDVPPGRETTLTLKDGVVVSAQERPYDGSDRELPEHGWAQARMEGHFAKVEGDPTFAEIVQVPGWQRLRSTEVREFVQNTYATSKPDQIGRAARRFGELDVVVSYCELTALADLRPTYFANGYLPVLSRLIEDFGIRPRQYDLAHWILGSTRDSGTIAHLAYVPSADVMMLMPWDLLSDAERAPKS
jgi:hypothetical protein